MTENPRLALRDAVHAALGSPPILPSTSCRVEMEFEKLEEHFFERGVEHVRKHAPDVEEWVGAMLDVLEEKEGRRVFDREKFDEALAQVNVSGRRGSLNPLHQKPLAFEKAGHEAQPMPPETKWDKKPAMTRAEATNFIDHVLAARFGQTNRDVTDEILVGVYGGERKADMGNTDFAPDWGRGTPNEADTMDPERA